MVARLFIKTSTGLFIASILRRSENFLRSILPSFSQLRYLNLTSSVNRRKGLLWEVHPKFEIRGGPVQVVMDESKELTTDFSPPDQVRGMLELDRDAFERTVHVPGFIFNSVDYGRVRGSLTKYALRLPGLTLVQKFSEPDCEADKVMILDPKFVRGVDDYDERVRYAVGGVFDFRKAYRVVELKLTYQNWTAEDILKAVLPEGEHITGYTIVGHLVHFNLKEHHKMYKRIIGEVILDKLKQVKTVVNKTDSIDSVYRVFKMELMAGKDETVVLAKENGCAFKFDFAKVYWNSRLGTEHERIMKVVEKGDVLYDVFAGVGPFAIPCAKKGAIVFANDLNPESYKWLNENIQLNSSKKKPINAITTYNMDGREFIKEVVKEDLKKRSGVKGKIHVVMNLPALAVEFLDAFLGLMQEDESLDKDIHVHCYTFSKSESDDHDPIVDVRNRVESVLGAKLADDHTIRHVRNVAPNKDMMCVSFVLPVDVLVKHSDDNDEPLSKKVKTDND